MFQSSKVFLIGISDIDEKHRHLVRLLNEAYEEFVMGINIENGFIDHLFNCMANCFDYEETLMIETSYTDFSEHKAEHDIFTFKFLEIYNHYKQDADTSIAILILLNNLINHHIRETDSKFGKFVQQTKPD